jgi:hypothetical protein
MNATLADLKVSVSAASFATERIGFVSQKKQEPFLPLLLRWLAKAHAWSATVLVDELRL